MRQTLVSLVVCLALLAACGSEGTTGDRPDTTTASSVPATSSAPTTASTTIAGPEWARPGLAFLDALGEGLRTGDTETILAFYHPDARLVMADVGATAFGWRQISDMVSRMPELPEPSENVVLIGDWLAAIVSEGGPGCGLDRCPEAWADLFVVYDGSIGFQIRAGSARPGDDDPLMQLYVGSAEAYSAHDVDAMLSFYSEAVFAPPLPREEYEVLFEQLPDLAAEPVTLAELGVGSSDAPALFDLGIGSSPIHSRQALGVYDVTVAPGVETIAATMWSLWDGEILEASTVFDPDGWQRLLDVAGLEPPVSWYSAIEVPTPRTVEVTQVVELDDGTRIELYNADADAAALVEWAVGRYEQAGMGIPHVEAIYIETEQSCLEGSAWSHLGGSAATIRLCLPEEELTVGGSPTSLGKVTMLHELAHVWAGEYLTDEDRARFLAERRLAVWSDASVAWAERGTEHAAEILAWGLAEDDFDLVRLGETECGALADAFRSLARTEPLHGC